MSYVLYYKNHFLTGPSRGAGNWVPRRDQNASISGRVFFERLERECASDLPFTSSGPLKAGFARSFVIDGEVFVFVGQYVPPNAPHRELVIVSDLNSFGRSDQAILSDLIPQVVKWMERNPDASKPRGKRFLTDYSCDPPVTCEVSPDPLTCWERMATPINSELVDLTAALTRAIGWRYHMGKCIQFILYAVLLAGAVWLLVGTFGLPRVVPAQEDAAETERKQFGATIEDLTKAVGEIADAQKASSDAISSLAERVTQHESLKESLQPLVDAHSMLAEAQDEAARAQSDAFDEIAKLATAVKEQLPDKKALDDLVAAQTKLAQDLTSAANQVDRLLTKDSWSSFVNAQSDFAAALKEIAAAQTKAAASLEKLTEEMKKKSEPVSKSAEENPKPEPAEPVGSPPAAPNNSPRNDR